VIAVSQNLELVANSESVDSMIRETAYSISVFLLRYFRVIFDALPYNHGSTWTKTVVYRRKAV
jgi:hypothetical protein